MRQRDVEQHGFCILAGLVGLWKYLQRAHDLQTVGKLYYKHPRVGRIAGYKLAITVGLELGVARFDLRDTIEACSQLQGGITAGEGGHLLRVVATGFMQEDRRDAVGIKPDFQRHNARHANGMFDKRMIVAAQLAAQSLLCNAVGLHYHRLLLVAVFGTYS